MPLEFGGSSYTNAECELSSGIKFTTGGLVSSTFLSVETSYQNRTLIFSLAGRNFEFVMC